MTAIQYCEEKEDAENDEDGNYWFADFEREVTEAVVTILYRKDCASGLWTDVSRELPQTWAFLGNCSHDYVEMTKERYEERAHYRSDKREWVDASTFKKIEGVTHWLKTPPFPRHLSTATL